jgi:hypothetical protein
MATEVQHLSTPRLDYGSYPHGRLHSEASLNLLKIGNGPQATRLHFALA